MGGIKVTAGAEIDGGGDCPAAGMTVSMPHDVWKEAKPGAKVATIDRDEVVIEKVSASVFTV